MANDQMTRVKHGCPFYRQRFEAHFNGRSTVMEYWPKSWFDQFKECVNSLTPESWFGLYVEYEWRDVTINQSVSAGNSIVVTGTPFSTGG